MYKLQMQTPNLTAQNIDKIAALFPNCITEMLDEEKSTPDHKVYKRGINFELLKQMLSPDVVDGDEAYEFTWVGKKASIVEANKPIRKTLRPCPEESKNWDDTENLYIEGDNLEVLKLLRTSYLHKVKMIYIVILTHRGKVCVIPIFIRRTPVLDVFGSPAGGYSTLLRVSRLKCTHGLDTLRRVLCQPIRRSKVKYVFD